MTCRGPYSAPASQAVAVLLDRDADLLDALRAVAGL
jgi:hypothetical protein